MDERLVAFERLLNIMDDLREKCPWDKKQTLESLRHLTIEETYELADAILDNDMNELEGEIGKNKSIDDVDEEPVEEQPSGNDTAWKKWYFEY